MICLIGQVELVKKQSKREKIMGKSCNIHHNKWDAPRRTDTSVRR